jgi:aryl-alcohol dehydrogenase-like predicted oxidoreductase
MDRKIAQAESPIIARRDVLRYGAAAGTLAASYPISSLAAASPVIQRAIPKSGEKLPIVGVGTARVFDIDDTPSNMASRQAVLQQLFDGGGKLVDTAPSYGEAERIVGDLLTRMGARHRAFLATKVRSHGEEDGKAEITESFRRLKTDKIDLIQVHNLRDTRTQLKTLRGLKEAGKIRYIGVTHFRPSANDDLAEVMRNEELDFVQFQYSLRERSAEKTLLPLAADRGIAVLVNLPFGRSRLFRAVKERSLPEWAGEFGANSFAQMFLKYILSHPAVTCVIPGTDKATYMTDNLGAGRGMLPNTAQRKRIVQYWESL